MPEIGAFDDKANISQILVRAAFARLSARAAALSGLPFDWNEWKSYRDEGRR